MICEFCKNKCRLSHKENDNKIEVYDCVKCSVLTSFHISVENGSKIKTVFLLDRNEKLYIWTDHYQKGYSYITYADVSVTINNKDPLILKFPKLMNVNPSNVHDKFKFYMIFS